MIPSVKLGGVGGKRKGPGWIHGVVVTRRWSLSGRQKKFQGKRKAVECAKLG